MRRKRWLQTAIVLAVMCALSACGRGSHSEHDVPAPTSTQAVTPTEGQPGTSTPVPTKNVTVTPTVTAAPTRVPVSDLAVLAARSRELHNAIAPRLTANPLGTGPELSEADKKNQEYGFRKLSGVSTEDINLMTGEVADYSDPCRTVRVYGLKDQSILAKINERIETAARTMIDPDYLPDVPGIMLVVKERGLPEAGVQCYAGSCNGILHVGAEGRWIWHEDMEFADYDELLSYVNADEKDRGILLCMDYTVLSETGNRMKVRFDYGLTETIEYNFDLSTGEEISLSDLFPAGFDYLTYLNEEMEKESKYVFWFSDYEYQKGNGMQGTHSGGAYDETQEYDGGHLPEMITGDEMFCLGSYCVELRNSRGEWEVIDLPAVVADRDRNGDIYQEQQGVYVEGALGYVRFCSLDMDGPLDTEEIGQFRVRPNGTDKDTQVIVYRGIDRLDLGSEYNRDFGLEIKESFTDAKILEYAKQCIPMWVDPGFSDANCKLYITDVEVYPNGYYNIEWLVSYTEFPPSEDDWWSYYPYQTENSWMKDGIIITKEELLDVSYEELLAELIADLSTEYSGTTISEDDARTAAKALMPYFVELEDNSIVERQDYWSWDDYLFLWKEGSYVHSGPPNHYTVAKDPVLEGVPEEFEDLLPQILRSSLSNAGDWLKHSDPYILLKHLKMYKGYPFP